MRRGGVRVVKVAEQRNEPNAPCWAMAGPLPFALCPLRGQGCDMLRGCALKMKENVLDIIYASLTEAQVGGAMVSWSQTEAVLYAAANVWREAHYDVTHLRRDSTVGHAMQYAMAAWAAPGPPVRSRLGAPRRGPRPLGPIRGRDDFGDAGEGPPGPPQDAGLSQALDREQNRMHSEANISTFDL